MALPRELEFLARPIGVFAYEPSWAGLLRIAAWTLCFLLLGGRLIPEPPVDVPNMNLLEGTRVIPMSTTEADPRWVRQDIKTFPKDKYVNIAWLTGSSALLLKPGKEGADAWASVEFLPDKVNEVLENKFKIEARTFLYLIASQRILDTYTMVLDAVSRKPDAIVLSLNPFWTFNNQAVFYRPSLFNRGADLWWNSDDWPWLFTLSPPSSHLWNWVGRHFRLLAARHDYQIYLIQRGKALIGTDLKELRDKEAAPVKGGVEKRDTQVEFRQPLMFWVLFRTYAGDLSYFFPHGEVNVQAWQTAALRLANTNARTWPYSIVRKTLTTLRNSGIPAFVYIPPVSPEMNNNATAMESYDNVVSAIEELRRVYESDKLRIVTHFPKNVVDSMNFHDYMHVDKGGTFPECFSEYLSKFLLNQ